MISRAQETPDSLIERATHVSWPLPRSLWATHCHRLYVLSGLVCSLLVDEQGKLRGVTTYRNRGRLSQEMFLRFLFEQEASLTQPYLLCEVVLGEGPFFLLPATEYRAAHLLPLARALLDDAILADELQHSFCPLTEAHAVFSASTSLMHVLRHYLADFELQHISRYVIQSTHRLADQVGQAITLTLLGREVLITVLRDGCLQLCNRYPYREPLEAIYFLQTVRQVAGLDQSDLTCYVMGETNPRDLSPASIWHHLPSLQTPPLPRLLDLDLREHTPYWQFLFLV